jgi:hypothetical protein
MIRRFGVPGFCFTDDDESSPSQWPEEGFPIVTKRTGRFVTANAPRSAALIRVGARAEKSCDLGDRLQR